MNSYYMGIGEVRIVEIDFSAIVPSGVTISSATAHVETLAGVADAGFTCGAPVIAGTDVALRVEVGAAVTPGTYQLEVEATLSNGEEVQARDARGYGMILVVRH